MQWRNRWTEPFSPTFWNGDMKNTSITLSENCCVWTLVRNTKNNTYTIPQETKKPRRLQHSMQTSELVLNPQLALEAVSAQHLKLRWAAYINHRAQHTAVPRTQISSLPPWESHFPSKISLALNVILTIDQCHTSQKGSTVLYFAAMHSLAKPQTEKTQRCTTAGNWSY